MTSETPELVRIWQFRQAPPEFRALFPEGSDSDWVAHVPASDRNVMEPTLLQWRPVYPVLFTELPDRSVVYLGSPIGAMELVVDHGQTSTVPPPGGLERRTAARVQVECPSRYETSRQAGFGHTIDMSRTGIAFTTEGPLPIPAEVILRTTWPVRLEGGALVDLHAIGKLVRAEAMRAAMSLDSLAFSIKH